MSTVILCVVKQKTETGPTPQSWEANLSIILKTTRYTEKVRSSQQFVFCQVFTECTSKRANFFRRHSLTKTTHLTWANTVYSARSSYLPSGEEGHPNHRERSCPLKQPRECYPAHHPRPVPSLGKLMPLLSVTKPRQNAWATWVIHVLFLVACSKEYLTSWALCIAYHMTFHNPHLFPNRPLSKDPPRNGKHATGDYLCSRSLSLICLEKPTKLPSMTKEWTPSRFASQSPSQEITRSKWKQCFFTTWQQ